MEPIHMPTHRSFSLDIPDCAASTETQIGPLVGTAAISKPWLVAFDGQDSFVYARAAAAESANGKDGVLFASAPPNQAPHASSYSNPPMIASNIPLPISFCHARFLAETLKRKPLPQCDHPPSTSSSSPDVAQESNTAAQTLEDLRTLATWPRLRDPTLPDPIVGELGSDPAGIADRLGVKGLSVFTAFIEMESLRCRACGHQSRETALAALHQRHQRHFQR